MASTQPKAFSRVSPVKAAPLRSPTNTAILRTAVTCERTLAVAPDFGVVSNMVTTHSRRIEFDAHFSRNDSHIHCVHIQRRPIFTRPQQITVISFVPILRTMEGRSPW